MFGETTIFYVKVWNHPTETTIYKQMAIRFQVRICILDNVPNMLLLDPWNMTCWRISNQQWAHAGTRCVQGYWDTSSAGDFEFGRMVLSFGLYFPFTLCSSRFTSNGSTLSYRIPTPETVHIRKPHYQLFLWPLLVCIFEFFRTSIWGLMTTDCGIFVWTNFVIYHCTSDRKTPAHVFLLLFDLPSLKLT